MYVDVQEQWNLAYEHLLPQKWRDHSMDNTKIWDDMANDSETFYSYIKSILDKDGRYVKTSNPQDLPFASTGKQMYEIMMIIPSKKYNAVNKEAELYPTVINHLQEM